MNYKEEKDITKPAKQAYLDEINCIISKRKNVCKEIRFDYAKDIFKTPEKYRSEFKEMLGWPLVNQIDNSIPSVESEKLYEENGYSIFRMKIEVLDGFSIRGLFFKKETATPLPLVIVQHGGDGTPELVSGIYGETFNYNNILERVIKHNVHAFLPQFILWSEIYNVSYDRKALDASLKRVGSSITALEVYSIIRILDYFETQDYITNFGMIGLSYGGFYTLFTSAVDTRIKSAISYAFFNKRDAVDWSDWTWFKSAEKFDDAEVACLCYPRHLCIEIGDKDPLFDAKYGVESFEHIKDLSADVGTEWIDFTVFDGVHETSKYDTPIEKLIKDLK